MQMTHESASVTLTRRDGGTWVSHLYSTERRQGHADALLKNITDWADEHKIPLFLEAKQYGHPIGPGNEDLKQFYIRHGFVHLPRVGARGRIIMKRPWRDIRGI